MRCQTFNDCLSSTIRPLQLRNFGHIMSSITIKSIIYEIINLRISFNGCIIINCRSSQNAIRKSDQPIVYAYKFFNSTKHNYSTTKKEALTLIFVLHKFKHYVLGNKFVFYVDHMALV